MGVFNIQLLLLEVCVCVYVCVRYVSWHSRRIAACRIAAFSNGIVAHEHLCIEELVDVVARCTSGPADALAARRLDACGSRAL